MNEILVACGDMALLKQILSELPAKAFKPIATRNGAGTAQKVAHRNLVLAIVHADLADGQANSLLQELRAHKPALPLLLLVPGAPPTAGPFTRALRYPIPGPVFRNAINALVKTEEPQEDLERWRAFYNEIRQRLTAAENQSYFQLLGVHDHAPHHLLVRAFDALSVRFHPDRYNQYRDQRWGEALYQKTNELYKRITFAYGILSDRRLRKLYEEALAKGQLHLSSEEVNLTDRGPRPLEELATTTNGRRFLRLAQIEIAKGNHPAALQNLQFALSMEPDNGAIKEKIAQFQAQP